MLTLLSITLVLHAKMGRILVIRVEIPCKVFRLNSKYFDFKHVLVGLKHVA